MQTDHENQDRPATDSPSPGCLSVQRIAAALRPQATLRSGAPGTRLFGMVSVTLGVALIAMTGVVVLGKQKAAAPLPAQRVSRPIPPRVVVARGKVEPVREIKISPEVSGEIVALPVMEGQQVKAGDLLLKIKPDFYIASRDQAEGNYQSALAGVEMAEATLRQAEAELKRNQELHRSGLVSDAVLEQVETAYQVDKAQLVNAQGQMEMARASLAKAQYDLDKTTIFSPISGTIVKLNSELGERVVGTATMAGTQVMTIADLNEMDACVEISEKDIDLIRCGQKVQLEANAYAGRSFDGNIAQIATSSDGFGALQEGGARGATQYEVRIRIQDRQAFRPGMSVLARIRMHS